MSAGSLTWPFRREPMFFDTHPDFLRTSRTAASRRRLNLRHLAIIQANEDILRGRSVVDIASHDGRWSYAALEAGATHVIGIEGRRRLVQNTRRTFAAKGVDESRYTMIRGDVHRKLHSPAVTGDVVLCLGFLYHTARYAELMAGIRSTGAEYVIVDTRVLQGVSGPLVALRTEGTAGESLAIKDRFAHDNRVISAVPSEEAVELMLAAAGYEVDHRTDWSELLTGRSARSVSQYVSGMRVTLRARRRG
jgi:methyltransferase family protein